MENRQQIRSHLTKEQRLPRCFKEVEKVLRSVKSCKQNYKTILANSRLRGHIHKKVYSLTANVLKYYSYLQKVIDEVHLLEKEKYLKREMASILVYELIFGNGYLPGESKVVKTLQLYENEIFRTHELLQNKVEGNLIIEINVPRYVRVHTLVTTVPYVIKDLISYGFHQVTYDSDLPEEKYLELVKGLNKGSFLIDFHFKDVLVFEHNENLISLDLYKNGHIFLQDKASYIPVHVLNPQPACAVLDACAAPGMKTVHIAAKMKNKGILIACERDKSRFECLKKMLECGSVKICKTLCKDFKLIDPSDQAYSTIEYILIDPSCSGSGMVNRMDEVTDTEDSKNTERLSKLAGFQIILLKHSLKFPAVKRVVYSTCSIHEEENEYVVHEALNAFRETFKLIPAMPEWSHRGSEKFEFGKLCLRTDPKMHLTNGFFVAVFERINYDESAGQDSQTFEDGNFNLKKEKKKPLKQGKGYEKAFEDYDNVNLKEEMNISHPLELNQMNGSVRNSNENSESFVQTMNYEQEHAEAYTHQTKKHKKKKKEKSNEYFEQNQTEEVNNSHHFELNQMNDSVRNSNENSGNFVQTMDYEQEQTEIHAHQTKKHKKKKREKSIECIELNQTKEMNNCVRNGNENSESYVQTMNYAQEHTEAYAHQTKKHKKKKREKSNEYFEQNQSEEVNNSHHLELNQMNDSVRNSNENSGNYEQEQTEIYVQQTKKHKKKKREKSIEYIEHNQTEELSNAHHLELNQMNDSLRNSNEKSESFVQNVNCEQEQNGAYTHQTKKHKKKKKEKSNEYFNDNLPNSETSDKQTLKYSKSKKHSDILFSENNNQIEKDKFKHNKHQTEGNSIENIDAVEELTDVTKLHKKKKKKEHIEIETLNPGELNQDSEHLINMTSSCKKKKKKKKENSNVD